MSGHSKWSTIKRAKGANDARRGATFTKLSNAITIAVREGGGGDPAFNFRLRLAIDKAKEANMPKENVSRAIEKGLGKGDGAQLENILFEGFAPHGVAVLVEAVTDNRNRTSGEVRTLFTKNGGSLGGSGSVSYLFKKLGEIKISKNSLGFDSLMEKAMDAGAEDLLESETEFFVYTAPENLHQVRVSLESMGLTINSAALIYHPNKETLADIKDQSQAEQVLNFLESLEELDDVQNVYSNLE